MDSESVFKKYYKRVRADSLLKSAVWGVAIGFGIAFVVAFITWFTEFNGLWIAIGLGVAGCAVSVPSFYYFKYRPTTEHIARKLDSLGLEERMITMTELRGDESYIAMRQREDAIGKVSGVSARSIALSVSKRSMITCIACAVAGIVMTVITALSGFGVIPGFADVVDPDATDAEFAVEYIVEDDEMGYILGEDIQVVMLGESTTKVTAVANEGYMFDGWDDGVKSATRFEKDVRGDMAVTAMFVELDGDGDGDGDGDSDSNEGDSDNSSSGDPSDSNNSNNNSGGSQVDNTAGNFKDGKTPYRSEYEKYYQQAMQYLAENGEIPGYLRDIIESYFNILL